jgi:hypothetical protein
VTFFPTDIEAIAKEWRELVTSPYSWKRSQNTKLQHGGAGGYEVEADGFRFRGYLKPTTLCSDEHPIAAHEKIAADLAYELNVPVPPVVLYLREATSTQTAATASQGNEEARTCVSLITYDEQHEWQGIMDLAGQAPAVRAIIRASMARCSGAIVLDLLLGQTDRNNGRNVIFGINPKVQSQSSFLFLDFANSMNMTNRWAKGQWSTVTDPGFPGIMKDSLDRSIIKETLDRLLGMSQSTIEQIVRRIGSPFMTDHYKTTITEGIIGRRQLVPDFVTRQYINGVT